MTEEPSTTQPVRQRRLLDGRVRAQTESMMRLTKEALLLGQLLYPASSGDPRPATRSECESSQRPCPYVGCKYHLFLEVNPETGSIKFNFPDKEPWELEHSCSLDIADRGGQTLESLGVILNVTRERMRQIEGIALRKLKEVSEGLEDAEMSELWQQAPSLLPPKAAHPEPEPEPAAAEEASEDDETPVTDEPTHQEPDPVPAEETAVTAALVPVRDTDRWINVRQAAALLDCSRGYIELLFKKNRIRRRGDKGHYEYSESDLRQIEIAPKDQRTGFRTGAPKKSAPTPAPEPKTKPKAVAVKAAPQKSVPTPPPYLPKKPAAGAEPPVEELGSLLEQSQKLYNLWVKGEIYSRVALGGIFEAMERMKELIEELKA